MEFDFVIFMTGFRPTDRNIPFYCKLGNELIQRGYTVGLIIRSNFADKIVATYRHTYFGFYDMLRELKGKREISYFQEAERIEQTYNISIKNYCLAEAKLIRPHSKNDKQLAEQVVEDFQAYAQDWAQRRLDTVLDRASGI